MKPDQITRPCPGCKKPILAEYALCLACALADRQQEDEDLRSIAEIDFFGED